MQRRAFPPSNPMTNLIAEILSAVEKSNTISRPSPVILALRPGFRFEGSASTWALPPPYQIGLAPLTAIISDSIDFLLALIGLLEPSSPSESNL